MSYTSVRSYTHKRRVETVAQHAVEREMRGGTGAQLKQSRGPCWHQDATKRRRRHRLGRHRHGMTCLNVHGHKMVLQRAPSSPALQARASAVRKTAEMRLLHLGGGVDGRGSRHREEGGAVRRHADLIAFPKYGAAAASACRQPCSAGGAHASEELGTRDGKRAREGQEIRSWADTTTGHVGRGPAATISRPAPLHRGREAGRGRRSRLVVGVCREQVFGLFLSFARQQSLLLFLPPSRRKAT